MSVPYNGSGSIMMVSHRAPSGGKSSACGGPTQVVLGIAVSAGKLRATESENVGDLGGRRPLREQAPGHPEIHDAPVRLREFADAPPLHTAAIDLAGCRRADTERIC